MVKFVIGSWSGEEFKVCNGGRVQGFSFLASNEGYILRLCNSFVVFFIPNLGQNAQTDQYISAKSFWEN